MIKCFKNNNAVLDERAYQSTNMVLDSTLGPEKVLKTED